MKSDFNYDIAISYASEDHSVAEEIASQLKEQGIRVFFDRFETDKLWGKDLYQHFQSVFCDQARFCIVVISKHYVAKNWTMHELRQAQARALKESSEYILPLRLDDSRLPGLNYTIGYVDFHTHGILRIVDMIVKKLNQDGENGDTNEFWNGELIIYNGVEVAPSWPAEIEKAQNTVEYGFRRALQRIKYGDEKNTDWRADERPCPDCAVLKGQYHVPSCDIEECPNCGGQAIGCDCEFVDDF